MQQEVYSKFRTVVNHTWNGQPDSIPEMPHRNTRPAREIVWNNALALMRHHWGRENLQRLGREARNVGCLPIGASGASYMKSKKNIGLDKVDAVATVFGLSAWQLLIPNLDPSNVPVIMISEDERQLYDKLKRVHAVLKES